MAPRREILGPQANRRRLLVIGRNPRSTQVIGQGYADATVVIWRLAPPQVARETLPQRQR